MKDSRFNLGLNRFGIHVKRALDAPQLRHVELLHEYASIEDIHISVAVKRAPVVNLDRRAKLGLLDPIRNRHRDGCHMAATATLRERTTS